MSTIGDLKSDFQRLASPQKARTSAWFFKTGKGEYGHGDTFLGVTVPEQRRLAKQYRDLPLLDVLKLLKSKYHEHRLTAVFILGGQFARGNSAERQRIVRQYLRHTKYINSWDMVDSSATHILGTYLLDKPRTVLYKSARSKNLWERRIAILATQTFIRHGQFADTIKLATMLLRDQEDLMHKAVGWMLREVGDRERSVEERFLRKYAAVMPRIMLRYAIEKFPAARRRTFLNASAAG